MAKRTFEQVAVLMGGPSAERDVSLRSGAAVCRALRDRGYRIEAVDVAGPPLQLPQGTDAVFIALHGTYGEDGAVQAELNRLGVPYTGSGVRASRTAFDKEQCKRVLVEYGLPTPPYEVLTETAARRLPLPVVVKPPREGSSIGVHTVFDEADWPSARAAVLRLGDRCLVERYIDGRELTVGVFDGRALPVVEITVPGGWYDYRAKYTRGESVYTVPALLDAASAAACRALAVRACAAVGCRGAARVDFRLSGDGTPTILEINTIPGLTETSLLPMAAAADGMGFAELCERILARARTDAEAEA